MEAALELAKVLGDEEGTGYLVSPAADAAGALEQVARGRALAALVGLAEAKAVIAEGFEDEELAEVRFRAVAKAGEEQLFLVTRLSTGEEVEREGLPRIALAEGPGSTMRTLLTTMGVAEKSLVEVEAGTAPLSLLSRGEADALAVFVPHPIGWLRRGLEEGGGLVPLATGEVESYPTGFAPALIPPEVYPGIPEEGYATASSPLVLCVSESAKPELVEALTTALAAKAEELMKAHLAFSTFEMIMVEKREEEPPGDTGETEEPAGQ